MSNIFGKVLNIVRYWYISHILSQILRYTITYIWVPMLLIFPRLLILYVLYCWYWYHKWSADTNINPDFLNLDFRICCHVCWLVAVGPAHIGYDMCIHASQVNNAWFFFSCHHTQREGGGTYYNHLVARTMMFRRTTIQEYRNNDIWIMYSK